MAELKIFDAADNARLAYAENTGKIDLDIIAARWGNYMIGSYSRAFSIHPEQKARFDTTSLISGYFVGIDWQDKMIVSKEQIVFNLPNNFSMTPTHNEFLTADTAFIQPPTHIEVVNEFIDNGTTKRAKDMLAEWKAQTANYTYVEKMSAQAALFVKAVRDWSGDQDVGGDIAVLILERGKKWGWFNRPGFCPEH